MPRAKKKIQVQIYLPLPENQKEFQKRVNIAYSESVDNYLKHLGMEKEKKKEVLDLLIKRIEETEMARKTENKFNSPFF